MVLDVNFEGFSWNNRTTAPSSTIMISPLETIVMVEEEGNESNDVPPQGQNTSTSATEVTSAAFEIVNEDGDVAVGCCAWLTRIFQRRNDD